MDRLFPLLNRGTANGVLDRLMPCLTNLHHHVWFLALAVVVCGVLVWRGNLRTRVGVLCALLAVGLADVMCSRIIKPLVPRERPCARVLPSGGMAFATTRLVPGEHCPGSRSFPSNHAANTMALGGVGWWFTRRCSRWLWLLLPLVIGYSRIYLGYHYPSDVVGGWLIGALFAAMCVWLSQRVLRQNAA
jgi:membrane-associated phospholipid phosphatase